MRVRRSMLTVPANVPRLVDKAREQPADIIYFDLQDAIAKVDRAKVEARDAAVAAIRRGGFAAKEVCVRVNSPGSPWFVDDVKAVVEAGVDSIKLTHSYGADDVAFAERCILAYAGRRTVEVQLAIDMPAALVELEEIAKRSTLITAVWLSSGDYSLELGSSELGPHSINNDERNAYARGRIINVARSKGWNAGDIVRPANPTDLDEVAAAMRRSKAFGFDGTVLMYPRQIAVANETYGVSEQEWAWAKDFVTQWEAQDDGPDWNKGFRLVNGKNYVAPYYEYACRVLTFAAVLRGEPDAVAQYARWGLASEEYQVERRARPIAAESLSE